MFKTFEEVSSKYPIGTKMNYEKTKMTRNYFYARPEDLIEYRKEFDEVEVISDTYAKCVWYVENYDPVDGYIFTGQGWYPAMTTWDGWVPIRERENIE